MENYIKINIVGVSKRVIKYYSPLLKNLIKENKISIGFIYNRNIKKADFLKEILGNGKPIDDLKNLKNNNKKNITIVSLPSRISYEISKKLIKLGFNLFIETPIAGKLWQAEKLIKLKDKYQIIIGVGEDYCFAPEALLLRSFCRQYKMPELIHNVGKSSSYHAFALFTTLYESEDLPTLKKYTSQTINTKNLSIKNETYEFSDHKKYIIQSFLPDNYLARNLGEIKLYYEDLTLTDKYFINKDTKKINQLLFEEKIKNSIRYKSNLIKGWNIEKLHKIKPNFPMEESKTNGLYYNLINFIEAVDNQSLKVPYGIEHAKLDLYLSKIQYINKRLKISNLIFLKSIIFILKFLRKI